MPADSIDLLFCVDILSSIYLDKAHKGTVDEPMAVNTVFCWVLTGPTNSCDRSPIISFYLSISEPLNSTIRWFWELEELPIAYCFLFEFWWCVAEEVYPSTTTRLSSRRLMVFIPFQKPFLILDNGSFPTI